MEEKETLLIQILNVLISTIPGIVSMVMINPNSLWEGGILIALLSPIVTQILKHLLIRLKVSQTFEYKLMIENEVEQKIVSFFKAFPNSIHLESKDTYDAVKLVGDDIEIKRNSNEIIISFSSENIELLKNIQNYDHDLLNKLKGQTFKYNTMINHGYVVLSFIHGKNSLYVKSLLNLVIKSKIPTQSIEYRITKNGDNTYDTFIPIPFERLFLSKTSQLKEHIDIMLGEREYYKMKYIPFKKVFLFEWYSWIW